MQLTVAFIALLVQLAVVSGFGAQKWSSTLRSNAFASQQSKKGMDLDMYVYSSEKGVPAALVEERDACGVGFIASMDQRKSHDILKQSLNALTCMEHRGATSADNISGDGAGIMTDIPWKLYEKEGGVDPAAVKNADGSNASGVGMIFLPNDDTEGAIEVVNAAAEKLGLNVLMWRDVPTDDNVLGQLSAGSVPVVKQIVLQVSLVQDIT